jgi:hypothetical protein
VVAVPVTEAARQTAQRLGYGQPGTQQPPPPRQDPYGGGQQQAQEPVPPGQYGGAPGQ